VRAILVVPIVGVLVTTARASHAKPTVGECLSATEASLKLGADRKVREVRAQALVCAAPSCPAEVRVECATRVADLNAAVPTVVFSAKGADGQELSSVKVSMDGEALSDHLDGSAVAVDPGTHEFTYDMAGQATLIIHEGEKNRHEVVLMAPPGVIAGGVLAAGGLTLYLTAPKGEAPRVGLQMGPRTLGVAGRF